MSPLSSATRQKRLSWALLLCRGVMLRFIKHYSDSGTTTEWKVRINRSAATQQKRTSLNQRLLADGRVVLGFWGPTDSKTNRQEHGEKMTEIKLVMIWQHARLNPASRQFVLRRLVFSRDSTRWGYGLPCETPHWQTTKLDAKYRRTIPSVQYGRRSSIKLALTSYFTAIASYAFGKQSSSKGWHQGICCFQ